MADLEEIGLPPSAVERIAVHFGTALPSGAEPELSRQYLQSSLCRSRSQSRKLDSADC